MNDLSLVNLLLLLFCETNSQINTPCKCPSVQNNLCGSPSSPLDVLRYCSSQQCSVTHRTQLCAPHGAPACEGCSVFLQQWQNTPLAINFSVSRLWHCCVRQSTVELLLSLYRTLRMQSVKHGSCTLVFYLSKLDRKKCFLITVSRFVFPRFVLEEKGLATSLWHMEMHCDSLCL